MMRGEALMTLTVGEIARADRRLVAVLGDLGIGPRYVAWRLCDATRDLQLDLAHVVRRLTASAMLAA